MHLIIGGAWQGKRDYAVKTFGLSEKQIYSFSEDCTPEWDYPCLNRLEEFVLYCVKNRLSAREILERNRDKWQGSVIICREIFSGVVPVDGVIRAWREETGRTLSWLAEQAEDVTRLFCGIPQKLK